METAKFTIENLEIEGVIVDSYQDPITGKKYLKFESLRICGPITLLTDIV